MICETINWFIIYDVKSIVVFNLCFIAQECYKFIWLCPIKCFIEQYTHVPGYFPDDLIIFCDQLLITYQNVKRKYVLYCSY